MFNLLVMTKSQLLRQVRQVMTTETVNKLLKHVENIDQLHELVALRQSNYKSYKGTCAVMLSATKGLPICHHSSRVSLSVT